MDVVSPSIVWSISLVGLYLGILLLIAELLGRLTEIKGEWTRKIVHIGSGHVLLFAWLLKIPAWIGIAAAIIAALVALISYQFPILPSINSVGRKSLGTFFYALSIGLLVGIFWTIDQPYYGVLGILVMAWGDGMAAIIGQKWGKHPYQVLGMTKSWEGSLTMTGVSFLISMLILSAIYGYNGGTWLISFVLSLFATFLESFSKLGIDNLTVPLGSALFAFYGVNLWLSLQ
ncbi:MAG: diacylglycerol/polyprenol kinase family protein [Microcystaceae cyanobacterium]